MSNRFIVFPLDLINNPKCSSRDFAVYLALVFCRSRTTGTANVGISKLCQISRVGKKTLYKSLNALKQEGYITISSGGFNPEMGNICNTYHFHHPVHLRGVNKYKPKELVFRNKKTGEIM